MKRVHHEKLVLLLVMLALVLQGCVSYITPRLGAVASEDSILLLDSLEGEPQAWVSDDLQLDFTTSNVDGILELTGELRFSNVLTNTWNRVRRFDLKLSFLDSNRQVLSTVNVAPLLSAFTGVPDRVKIHVSAPVPKGSTAIAFNYFGIFLGDEPSMGHIDVYYSPYI